jgi:hypothetical protein
MSEKMTDEDLEHELSQALSASRAAKVRAHIAALTAERNRLAEHVKATINGPFGPEVVLLAGGKNLPEWKAEADALRERVQTLEAKAVHFEKVAKGADLNWLMECERANVAESCLSAIRQRAGDVSGFFRASGGVGAPGWLERGLGFVLGDDARPSAPPEAFTHEKGLDAGVFDDAPLNPDATGEADQPLPEGPLEPADMTDEESGRICADAGVDVESGVAKCLETVAAKRAEKPAPFRSEDEDPPLLLPQTPARHYPTTSEAFAAVLDGISAAESSLGTSEKTERRRRGREALSILERRMGAMARAATEVLSFFPVGTKGPRKYSAEAQALSKLRLALTGAPPEDVEERARDVYESAIARREHQPAALALAVREALRLAPSGTVSASGPCGCGRPEAWTLEEVEQVFRREELGPATARRVREHLAALRRRP